MRIRLRIVFLFHTLLFCGEYVFAQNPCFETVELNPVDTLEEIRQYYAHKFLIKSLKDTLRVLSVRTSGVQSANYPKRIILPGHTDTIFVNSPLSGRPGTWNKMIVIMTDKCPGTVYTKFYLKPITPRQKLEQRFNALESNYKPINLIFLINYKREKYLQEQNISFVNSPDSKVKKISDAKRMTVLKENKKYMLQMDQREDSLRQQYLKDGFPLPRFLHAGDSREEHVVDIYQNEMKTEISILVSDHQYKEPDCIEHFYFRNGKLIGIKKTILRSDKYSPALVSLQTWDWLSYYFDEDQLVAVEELPSESNSGQTPITVFPQDSSGKDLLFAYRILSVAEALMKAGGQ